MSAAITIFREQGASYRYRSRGVSPATKISTHTAVARTWYHVIRSTTFIPGVKYVTGDVNQQAHALI